MRGKMAVAKRTSKSGGRLAFGFVAQKRAFPEPDVFPVQEGRRDSDVNEGEFEGRAIRCSTDDVIPRFKGAKSRISRQK